jgi:tetratricopeptide (TPR) repeat protein
MRTFEQIKASILNPQAHKRARTELDEDDEFESDDGSSSEFEEQ